MLPRYKVLRACALAFRTTPFRPCCLTPAPCTLPLIREAEFRLRPQPCFRHLFFEMISSGRSLVRNTLSGICDVHYYIIALARGRTLEESGGFHQMGDL